MQVGLNQEMRIEQLDVDTAFLYGRVKEDIWLETAPGFQEKDFVYKLLGAIYGLKQSPRVWYRTLKARLEEIGFRKSVSEPCLFIKGEERPKIILTIYVDDLVVA